MLGPRRDVPVLLLGPVGELRELHESLMDALTARGVALGHARNVRDRFTPHVSVRRRPPRGARLDTGDPVTVDHVALLRRGGGATDLVGRAPLAGAG